MTIRSGLWRLVFPLLLIGALAGCSSAPNVQATTQTAPASASTADATLSQNASGPAGPATEPPLSGSGPWQITLTTSDNIQLAGTLYGNGMVGLVLAPTYPGGQQGWASFGQAAAAKGYRALAIDLRGHGASQGTRSAADAPTDIATGIQFLRDHEAQKIVLIGAGAGGSAAILVAVKDPEVLGVAVISGPRSSEGLEVKDADLAALKVPSLWLAARNDMTQNAEDMYAAAGSSQKDLWIYEGSSLHGTYILEGADGPDLQRRLLDFIAKVTT